MHDLTHFIYIFNYWFKNALFDAIPNTTPVFQTSQSHKGPTHPVHSFNKNLKSVNHIWVGYYVTIFVANKELWLDCEFTECNYIALFDTGVFVQFTVEMSYSVIKVILHGIVLCLYSSCRPILDGSIRNQGHNISQPFFANTKSEMCSFSFVQDIIQRYNQGYYS